MLILKDMVHILTSWCRYNSGQWQSFELLLSPKEKELLAIIRSDNALSESEKRIPSKYKKSLTSKLCKELTFFPGKLPDVTDYQSGTIECSTLLYSLKLVSTLSIRHTPIDLAKRLVVLSRTFDLTNHRMAVLKHLCSYYADVGDIKYKSYLEEFQQVRAIVKAEDTALYLYNELIVRKRNTKLEQLASHDLALESLYALDVCIENGYVSVQFYIWYFRIKIIAARLVGDYEEALHCAIKGFEYFDNLPFRHIQGLQEFLSLLAECYLHTKNLTKARESILSLFDIGTMEGSPEWISSMRLLVRLELSEGNYNESYLTYHSLTTNKQYLSFPSASRIIEKIQEQYFNILVLMGHITNTPKPSRISINRFLKNDPEIDFNRKEVRIPLIIAQLLYNIYYKEYDSMMSRLETLKDYCARRLSPKSPFRRSNLFIRMLLVVPSSNFNSVASKRNGMKYFNRMKGTSYNITNHDTSIEIIPYEQLWKLVLNHLKKPRQVSEYQQVRVSKS